ncbi:MAG: hypothetical protein KDB02_04705 [Acidimicrobiales bacterium]|nr:hypothetical protein [Acidimicrobiales bacterium]
MSRGLRVGICLAVLLAGGIQVSVAFSRSLIPYRIDGTLRRTGVVTDSHQQLLTLTVDKTTYEVDDTRVAGIRIGRHITKDPWSATMLLDGRKPFRLAVGDEVFRFLLLTVLACSAAWLLTGKAGRGAGDPDETS